MKWVMPVGPIESGPLTDQEIEELDAFLLAEDGLENGESMEAVASLPKRPFQYFGHTGFGTRQLYTDEEEMLFDAMRPVALTAIDNVVIRGDLADRSLFLSLRAIPDDKHQRERVFWKKFERDRPHILGALLDAVAHGLRELPNVKLDGYRRMADFAEWGTACEGALWEAGTFVRAYESNRARAAEDVIEADLVASAIVRFMAEQPKWNGETDVLLESLNSQCTESQRNDRHWPKASNALSSRLTRAKGTLRNVGIKVRRGRDPKTNRRTWHIEKLPPPARKLPEKTLRTLRILRS
jgi:hypothetical protein